MAHGTCAICGNVGRLKRGWCTKHYQRWRDHDDPLWEPKRRDPSQYDSTGHRLHQKTCPSCDNDFLGRTDQVTCSKSCALRGGPVRGGAGRSAEANSNWRGDDVGYDGMHIRVRKARGKADRCEQCGTTDQSLNYDWASLIDKPASVDDFAPMCRSCHRKFDTGRDRQRPGWQGQTWGQRTLTADLVRAAHAARAGGSSVGDLSRRFGVHRDTLRRALNGETWAWLVPGATAERP
jgi:hypothetical protein